MDSLVSGHCDERFAAVADAFAANLQSGADLGASVAVTYKDELVVDYAPLFDKYLLSN